MPPQTSIDDLMADPAFQALPASEQLKGLSASDPSFAQLPVQEQLKGLLFMGSKQKTQSFISQQPGVPQPSKQLPSTPEYTPADPRTISGAGQNIAEGLGSSIVDFGQHIPGKRLLEAQQSGNLAQAPFALGEAGGDAIQLASLFKGAAGGVSKLKSVADANKAANTAAAIDKISAMKTFKGFDAASGAEKAVLEKYAQENFGKPWMSIPAAEKVKKLAELSARKFPTSAAADPFAPSQSMGSRLMSVAGPAAKIGLGGLGLGAALKYAPLLVKLLSGE